MPLDFLRPDQIFQSRYRVVRRIKVGGMGAVYEAQDTRTDSPRALKLMARNLVDKPGFLERFGREARITGQIESDHLVRTFDSGVDESTGHPFLVMELLRGEDLGAIVKQAGFLAPEKVYSYLKQAAVGLDKMHAQNIVHRDLKPDNLFVTKRDDGSDCLKILDFGVAKVVQPGADEVTQSLGTPTYMSPEQIAQADLSPATDRFALAHVAYTLLVGEAYWAKDFQIDGMAVMRRIASGVQEPPSLRAFRRKKVALVPMFDAWFVKATAHAPADRYEKAVEQIEALADALGVATITTQSVISRASIPGATGSSRSLPLPSLPLIPISEGQTATLDLPAVPDEVIDALVAPSLSDAEPNVVERTVPLDPPDAAVPRPPPPPKPKKAPNRSDLIDDQTTQDAKTTDDPVPPEIPTLVLADLADAEAPPSSASSGGAESGPSGGHSEPSPVPLEVPVAAVSEVATEHRPPEGKKSTLARVGLIAVIAGALAAIVLTLVVGGKGSTASGSSSASPPAPSSQPARTEVLVAPEAEPPRSASARVDPVAESSAAVSAVPPIEPSSEASTPASAKPHGVGKLPGKGGWRPTYNPQTL